MITDVADYFVKGCGRCARFETPQCSTRRWAGGLQSLRAICLKAGLRETAKWGHPCYMHAGRNIVLVSAFQDDFRLTFFDAALMKDPNRVLEKNGPNTRHAGMIRFVDTARVAELKPVIVAYLLEAIGNAEAGLKAPKEQSEIELPDELAEALDADPELAEAFHNLTPGRQRSYVIVLGAAKASATRVARIQKLRPKILAGRGANER